MTESFAQLFEESLKDLETRQGAVVKGTIVAIQKGFVLVDTGSKSESAIPSEEFLNAQGELEVQVGDVVDVVLKAVDDGFGETVASRADAKRNEAWIVLEKAYDEQATVLGLVNGKVKGGFTVELNGVRAFLPGSLVDTRPVRDADHLLGKELEFKVIKLDQKRNNVVVSRRAVIESESSQDREEVLANLSEGAEVKGTVKNLTDYGAFVDIGGVDGLLHISEISWGKLKHPKEVLNIGDIINVKILALNEEKGKISLGLKQTQPEPWSLVGSKYEVGQIIEGKVVQIKDYGAFVELEAGLDGLVHISEIANRRVENVSDELELGNSITAKIMEIDPDRKRISLSIKALLGDEEETEAEAESTEE